MTQRSNFWKSRVIEENAFWRAALERDAAFDGVFVFAVRSTGIYCRPSCPARRAARKRVVFFPLPEDAEAAGFRPCRRCRPRDAASRNPRVELVHRVCREIDTSPDGALSLQALSARTGVSPYHLQRTFKSVMKITPRQYADARRMDALKQRLRQGQDVAGATYDAGFGSSSRLYERASGHLGMTPATYRRGGRGMNIGYSIVDCALGRLLVAATERGVCAVSLGDSDAVLESALRSEYPNAQVHRDESRGKWVSALLRHVDGHETKLNLPVDLQATAFQRRVWEELRRIPYGATRSYSQVARAIGRPKAVRAVARACATNPVSVVIPCHRVVREDGSLGGYRWGFKRKQALLKKEKEPGDSHPIEGGKLRENRHAKPLHVWLWPVNQGEDHAE
ncbi:MAG: bifunctional DNA-binding transcriptional regulator/O6-methylguanine-DNA methyltransferase Ada [Acidobacteria bacterium]|nr:bifunctional DNA-binding transcriptional regulator/O6-methylguanine-DNA methyltransferase Ada [Acidobacteriota bacterium]